MLNTDSTEDQRALAWLTKQTYITIKGHFYRKQQFHRPTTMSDFIKTINIYRNSQIKVKTTRT